MITHIVMFKLHAEAEGKNRQENAQKIKDLLEALPSEIEALKKIEVGINFNSTPAAYDLVLTTLHNDEAGLKEYAAHPAHLEVLEFIKKVISDRKVVDYIS
ncbi:Dabb family protein [Persicobacter diffluens]|uniref:Stress responsive protein n=1 Tax=Persicobacter diffluens TaxID=981 RepID=A0AAN5AI98_9BACT|nr:stress responsive protein [Persicobacter diffluens]